MVMHTKIRRIVLQLTLLLVVFDGGLKSSFSQKPSKILEIYTDNVGFYFPAGRTLYTTIYRDGSLDYSERGDKEMVVKHRRLTSEQMEKLLKLVDQHGVKRMSGMIEANGQPARSDFQSNLEILIQRRNGNQEVTLRGFDPKLGRPYPLDLRELLCFIDEIRNASYRVSAGCE